MARKKIRKRGRRRNREASQDQQAVLFKAMAHPVRVKALAIISEGSTSPREIAERLDIPLSNVSYHVRVLDELGLIELREEEKVRGSVAHFYVLADREFLSIPNWEQLDPKVRNAFSGITIQSVVADAAASLAAGRFDQRSDRFLLRDSLVLDEKGWKEVRKAYDQLADSIEKTQTKARERLAGAEDGYVSAVAAALFFEMPPASAG